MKRTLLLCSMLALGACRRPAPDQGASGPVRLANDEQKTLYALGLVMGDRMRDFNLTRPELAIVQRGIADRITGRRPMVELEQFGPRIGPLARERSQRRALQERQRGTQYLERAAREPGAQRLPTGEVFRETRAGTGAQPGPEDRVRVNYRGTLIDGTEFDNSERNHEPVEFSLRGVIPCWGDTLSRLRVGGRAHIVCPPDTAYGDRGQHEIPPGSTLIFDIELVGIVSSDAGTAMPSMPMPGMMPPGMRPPPGMTPPPPPHP